MTFRRRAYSLIELLIVVGIFLILLSLLIPAVQHVREIVARTQCSNNLRQLGIALHSYHTAHGCFPAALGPSMGEEAVGPAHAVAPVPPRDATWVRSITPYLEQQGATWDQVLAILACPADPRGLDLYNPEDGHGFMSYLAVAGYEIYDTQGMMYLNSAVRAEQVTDGTSNTLLVVERPPAIMGTRHGWGWWESYDVGDVSMGLQVSTWLRGTSCRQSPQYFGPGADGATLEAFVLDPTFCHANHPWSFHDGGANMLLGDGSVHFVVYAAGPVLPALATIRGGENVQLPE